MAEFPLVNYPVLMSELADQWIANNHIPKSLLRAQEAYDEMLPPERSTSRTCAQCLRPLPGRAIGFTASLAHQLDSDVDTLVCDADCAQEWVEAHVWALLAGGTRPWAETPDGWQAVRR